MSCLGDDDVRKHLLIFPCQRNSWDIQTTNRNPNVLDIPRYLNGKFSWHVFI